MPHPAAFATRFAYDFRHAKRHTRSATREAPHAKRHTRSATREAPHAKRHTRSATREAPHAKRHTRSATREAPHAKRHTRSATREAPHAKRYKLACRTTAAGRACTCGPRAVYRNRRKHTKRGTMQNDGSSRTEVATLGGGCFWCLEAVYQELRGVEKVEAGDSGGDVPNPTYRQVCSETTGHAEVVQVTFDPDEVSYREILEFYFTIHDPTTLNRQGADVGTQYRSVIFYHTDEQKRTAEEVISEIEAEEIWNGPIVTEVVPLGEFYVAEDYHQNYFRNNGFQPY